MNIIKTKTSAGFTLVELLIVIVVIAILAAISVVAYNGIQSRARDNIRSSDVASIQKALEVYRVENGVYPRHVASGSNLPSGFSGAFGSSYSFSTDTAGNWLKNLTDDGVTASAPVDPINNNDHYYIYWASGPNGYGACTEPFYMLAVVGYESSANIPDRSRHLNCTGGGSTAHWTTSSNRAIFSNTQTP